ncbi:PAS domain S-box-containing protein/diguanylate cyclase (GGDEF)-like protein [Onishia taeanensis]|uniref:PAS domain S-box-containing protein/diguanylate cyclase (GGDEF)-like protein n=1 Tax=Onishia taeanensis TaxID=284577 RepID=A0A328XT59_9GAMM|nr:diguanylate cyclase [Halomonas taeanensis]RAR62218.1 PAS domain S-box-containing protein/diguanylate cyclase (GGDEF)-like protein [Halomonas taeanensis]
MMRILGTLHSRLMLWIGIGWSVLVVATLAFTYLTGSELIRQANISHLNYEAGLVARQVDRSIEQRIEALERLADGISPRLASTSGEAMITSPPLLALFDRLALVSREGKITASYPYLESLNGVDVTDRDYFRFARAVGRPYVSDPLLSKASGKPFVTVTVPLEDEKGGFAGQLIGAVNVETSSFFDSLRRIRIGTDGFASLISASGTVLSHPKNSRVMDEYENQNGEGLLDMALLGWQGAGQGFMADGRQSLEAYAQAWNAGWVVKVVRPMSQVQAPIGQLVEKLWWVGLVTIVLMLPLLWWLLKLVLKPLRRLERQIREVASGERERVKIHTRMSELSQLATTFNRLQCQTEEATASLHERQAFLDAVLASSPVGMFVASPDGEVEYMNPALAELTGYKGDDLHSKNWMQHIHPEDRDDFVDLWRDAMRHGRDFLRQVRYVSPDGEVLWLEIHVGQVLRQQALLGHVGSVKDITLRREQEALQRWEAEHDPLTGLLNRRGFERRLEEALIEWQQRDQQSVLMIFDLDHFKPINDEGGHALGDEMLRAIAGAITPLVRKNDYVARQGGDEFAILMPSCTLAQARTVSSRLLETVAGLSVSAEGKDYRVTLSLGAACFLVTDTSIDEILARADDASYQAKRKGRNRTIESQVSA